MQINSIKNIVMGTALAAIAGSSVINTCSNTTTQNNLSETAQIIHTPRIVPSHPRYSKDNFSSSQQVIGNYCLKSCQNDKENSLFRLSKSIKIRS